LHKETKADFEKEVKKARVDTRIWWNPEGAANNVIITGP
jgi:hypothetical protein